MDIQSLLREQQLAAILAERDTQIINLIMENKQLKDVILKIQKKEEGKEKDGDL